MPLWATYPDCEAIIVITTALLTTSQVASPMSFTLLLVTHPNCEAKVMKMTAVFATFAGSWPKQ